MTCSICGRPMETREDERTAYKQVVGWERPGRGAGGKSGSSLVLRRYTGAFAHVTCVVAAKEGAAPVEQQTLWSE